MKKLFWIAAIVTLLGLNVVSYNVGKADGKAKWYNEWSKTYDDAQKMGALIRYYDIYQTDGVDECDTVWFEMCTHFLKDCNGTIELPMYVYYEQQ